jgi:glucokinase
MAQYVLAGDIGGTKTTLAIYAVERPGQVSVVREASFPSQHYSGLETVITDFLRSDSEPVAAGAFGIAGPVLDEEAITTNLPWKITTAGMRQVIGCDRVRLMNDLEATAYGALFLSPNELQTLNAGSPRRGHRAVIAAGTGLGQAFLFWDGMRYRPVATEGGHADFAPRDEQEVELLYFLRKRYSRVSYERLLAGPGLVNIFNFLDQALHRPVAPSVRERLQTEDPAAVVGQAGVAGLCATCVEAVDIFLSLYGAQAGNLALTVMGIGGVYVGGGIVTKLLPKITTGAFMNSFRAKGRYAQLMAEIPVYIILNPNTSQLGAAQAACELLD